MLERAITQLGLSEKEAKVYLASLELGPSPVQVISQKSKVNRATAYVIIDSLMELGLMSTYEEGKKTFFTAESPDRFLEYLSDQERAVKKKIELLKEKIPELKSISNRISDKTRVKYFEGLEGIRAVQLEFIETLNNGDTIYTFLPFDNWQESYLKEKGLLTGEKRLAKGIKMQVIYTSKAGRQHDYEKRGKEILRDSIYVPHEKYPFEGGMNIYNNKIFMVDYKGKTGGLVIENKILADTLSTFFRILWSSLKNSKEIR